MTQATNQTPPHSPLRDDTDARLPAAAYLRSQSRADGWSAGRQAAFLSHLADNGVVEDAARAVGMSVGGGYALRRTSRGYAFNLGWEAALIIARRIVADRLMTATIKGEEARWVREEGVTTYTRQNTKLSLTLLDRVNPATTLAEVMAVATRFDLFLQLIDHDVSAQELWEYLFEDALPHSEIEARDRVRAALLLSEESADLEGTDDVGDARRDDDGRGSDDVDRNTLGPIEYKSMTGALSSFDDEYWSSQFVNTLSLSLLESPGEDHFDRDRSPERNDAGAGNAPLCGRATHRRRHSATRCGGLLDVVRRPRRMVPEGRIWRCVGPLSPRSKDRGRRGRTHAHASGGRVIRDLIKRMGAPLGAMGMGRAAIDEAPPRPVRPVQTHPLARAPRPRTCLIVDDSRVVRKVSRPMLESFGYSVMEAENGEEALARCKADMPGLVMLDWDMPVMTGIQFVTQLRALDSAHRPYVVFCTSRSETHDIFKGIEAGADEYVTKPFTHASLRAKLERIGAV